MMQNDAIIAYLLKELNWAKLMFEETRQEACRMTEADFESCETEDEEAEVTSVVDVMPR